VDAVNKTKLDTFVSDMKIKQQNSYLLEIRTYLLDKHWTKLPTDSMWFHPDYGIWHILFAYHLAAQNIEQQAPAGRAISCCAGFVAGAIMTLLLWSIF